MTSKILALLAVFALANFNLLAKVQLKGLDNLMLRNAEKAIQGKNPSQLNSQNIPHPYVLQNGEIYIQMLIKVADENKLTEVEKLGAQIIFKIGDIVALNVPKNRLQQLLDKEFVFSAEIPALEEPFMNSGVDVVRYEAVEFGSKEHNYLKSHQGKDVIVGIFDSGIDFKHPDFSNENGSRILYLWDMSEEEMPAPPANYDWGREYTKEQIDNDPESVRQTDPDLIGGHGTHVAGTAAGGGIMNAKYAGVATEADLIIIKGVRAGERGFNQIDIIAGCEYVFKKADELGKPAIVNLSLGSILGPHDGSTLYEQALSNLITENHKIVASAGNSGRNPIHAGTKANPGETPFMVLVAVNMCDMVRNFCPEIEGYFASGIDIWYEGDSPIDSITIAQLNPNNFQTSKSYTMYRGQAAELFELIDNGQTLAYISYDARMVNDPNNGDGNWNIFVTNNGNLDIAIANSLWKVDFHGSKGPKFDLWASVPMPENSGFPQLPGMIMGNTNMTIGSPATAKNIISVGSFISGNEWVDMFGTQRSEPSVVGDSSGFSSKGPSRDGRIVPIISAPGEIIASCLSSDLTPGIGFRTHLALQDSGYVLMRGTSMSAPHVTGALAVLYDFARTNSINLEEILSNNQGNWTNLNQITKNDKFTRQTPNSIFGWGKLDIKNIMMQFYNSVEILNQQLSNVSVFPNPTSNFVNISFDEILDRQIELQLVNSMGEVVFQNTVMPESKSIQYDVSHLGSGVYFVKFSLNAAVKAIPFTIIK